MAKFKAAIVPKAGSRADTVKSMPVDASTVLTAQIKAATKLSELPPSFRHPHVIKKFRATCFNGWMAADNPFDDFVLEADFLLELVGAAFKETFPGASYVPEFRDVFHRTVCYSIVMLTNANQPYSHFVRFTTTCRPIGLTLAAMRLKPCRRFSQKCHLMKSRHGWIGRAKFVWGSSFIRSRPPLDSVSRRRILILR
jgi:hypothetical protein